MLERVLEPEVMDHPDDARDYDAMDHAEVNRRFVDDLLATGPLAGDWLDLGTGTALIPLELCRRVTAVRVWGIDLAESMLTLGRAHVAADGLAERIHLERVDAKRLPYPTARFAGVMSNSIVHHLGAPAGALAEAVRVCTSGGRLFFRDLLRPASEAELARLVEAHAAGANRHQRQLFADSLRAALTLDEMRGLVSDLGYAPAGVLATSDRHWTWSATRKPPERGAVTHSETRAP